jgi:hypothetical protein
VPEQRFPHHSGALSDPLDYPHLPAGVPVHRRNQRCTKYPPSLDFRLMTLGPARLLLAEAPPKFIRFASGSRGLRSAGEIGGSVIFD